MDNSNQQKFSTTLFVCGWNSICEQENDERFFKAKQRASDIQQRCESGSLWLPTNSRVKN